MSPVVSTGTLLGRPSTTTTAFHTALTITSYHRPWSLSMIKIEELLKGVKLDSIPKQHQDNLVVLLQKLNVIREKYGKPLTVTSGYRSKEDQIRIYKAKGIPESKIPWGSAHLEGLAVDFSDPKGQLKAWIMQNIKLFEDLGLYMEDFSATPNWVHIQFRKPKSGARFFKP